MLISRRTFVFAAAATALSRPAFALGLPAGLDLESSFARLTAIREGRGSGTLHVLFAPWCHISPSIYADSRTILDRLTIRWIPFSGGQPEGREPTEILLRNGDPALLSAVFSVPGSRHVPMATPLCDEQDSAVARLVSPLVIRDTGHVLSTPTLAYRMQDRRVRVIPGGITRAQFEDIARLVGP